jgi:hypothetical protein
VKDPVEYTIDRDLTADISLDEPELLEALEGFEIPTMARDEIVDRHDRVPVLQEAFTKMRGHESGTAGHENAHGLPTVVASRFSTPGPPTYPQREQSAKSDARCLGIDRLVPQVPS